MSRDPNEPDVASVDDGAANTAKTESAQPSGRDPRDEFRDKLWNAFATLPGTRTFKIVGDELHEVPREEVLAGAVAEAFWGGVPERIEREIAERLDEPMIAVVRGFRTRFNPGVEGPNAPTGR